MRSGLVLSSLTAIALALASPAFAQQAPAGTAPGHMAAQGQNQKLSAKDRSFAQEAAMGGMAEVELGELAQQNAQNDEVKQFGSRMVQDHTQANQQLMPILSAENITMPQQLDEKHKATYDRLSKMRGAEFDRAYMRDMVQDHEKDVKKFRQEAEHANNTEAQILRAADAAGA